LTIAFYIFFSFYEILLLMRFKMIFLVSTISLKNNEENDIWLIRKAKILCYKILGCSLSSVVFSLDGVHLLKKVACIAQTANCRILFEKLDNA